MIARTIALFLVAHAAAQGEIGETEDYGGYHTWPELRARIDEWKRERPDLVHETSAGHTVEGREIVALRISDHAATDEDEPEILLMAGTHPREQPPQVLLVRLVEDILAGYGVDERITRLVDDRELWVIPVFNVDGKIYDMEHGNGKDRGAAWRKNRRANPDGTHGVDLNRQWPVRWGGSTDLRTRSSTNLEPRSDYFIGAGPMEEPETRALDRFFRDRQFAIFVDIHSPKKAIYFPRYLPESDHSRYTSLAREMRELQADPYEATLPRSGEDPPSERDGDCGLSHDWAYHVHGVRAFTFEVFAKPKWYPPLEQIDGEYANFKEPILHLIEAAGDLPRPVPGSAVLAGSSVDRPPSPGATVVWTPTLEGSWEYAVLLSGSAAVRVTSEIRHAPIATGFVVRVMPDCEAGLRVPMTLIAWDRERGRTELCFELATHPATPPEQRIHVGVYDFGDDGGRSVTSLERCLEESRFEVERLDATAIRQGALDGIDVLLVPGGSASRQSKELDDEGRVRIRAFVEEGGGYVGFCAGSYLASSNYRWSLGVLDAAVIDTEHWARGTGSVRIRLTPEGKSILGCDRDTVDVYYGQGPLLGPGGVEAIPDFTTLATYETEIAKKGAPEGVMAGTVAAAAGSFGKGRVLCFSPHPESTQGLASFVEHAVEWTAGRRPSGTR